MADRLEAVMLGLGIIAGVRECHDAQPGRRRVDWVYPHARPRPFALEVTSIVAAVDLGGGAAAKELGARLSELAESERLGAWIVALRTDRDVRRMEPDIVKILRAAQPNRERLLATGGSIRPGSYTDRDLMRLPKREWSSFVAEHERVKALGVEDLQPIESKREHVVYVLPTRTEVIESFSSELELAIAAKAPSLGLERDLERHLGVFLERWDRSNEPEETPVPEIPAEIDVLWVVHAWRQGFIEKPVWIARRGETVWRVLSTPSQGSGTASP